MPKAILIILRAALIAGLLTLWFPCLQNRWQALRSIPYPGSPQLWETLLGEDINPDTDEGSLKRAWLLGPLFLAVNSITWLPLTVPILYVFHKRRAPTRALGVIVLLAGLSSTVAGCWIYLPFAYWAYSVGVHLGENCFVFFALLPTVTLGAIAIIESYRILTTPQPQGPQQVTPL
jgi:hypothetical protein